MLSQGKVDLKIAPERLFYPPYVPRVKKTIQLAMKYLLG